MNTPTQALAARAWHIADQVCREKGLPIVALTYDSGAANFQRTRFWSRVFNLAVDELRRSA